MAPQTILRTGGLVLGLVLGVAVCTSAFAQTATSGVRAVQIPASSALAAAPMAAVRRQPRAAEVPATSNASSNPPIDRESPEDEALNRTINSICRGC